MIRAVFWRGEFAYHEAKHVFGNVFCIASFAEFTTRLLYIEGNSSSSVSCAWKGRSATLPLSMLIDQHLDHPPAGTPTGGAQQASALHCQVMLRFKHLRAGLHVLQVLEEHSCLHLSPLRDLEIYVPTGEGRKKTAEVLCIWASGLGGKYKDKRNADALAFLCIWYLVALWLEQHGLQP